MSRVRGGPGTYALVLLAVGPTAVAGALVAARVLAPSGRRGIEVVAFTPAGLPAALVGLVGALALVCRHRLLGRAVLVLAVTSIVVHAWWLAPRFAGDLPEAAAGAPALVVMVQNVENGTTSDVVAVAEEHHVDVLVVADTTDQQAAEIAGTSLARELPHTTLADGRGTVVWSRYPITSDERISELGESRMVSIDVPGPGQVRLVAAHPAPPYAEDGARWADDWEQVLDRVEQAHDDPAAGPVVVVGDLNATPDHWPLRTLAGWGFRDTAEQLNVGLAVTWPANGRESRLGISVPAFLSLDHVLTGPGMVAIDQEVTGAVGGDHLGVIATLARATR